MFSDIIQEKIKTLYFDNRLNREQIAKELQLTNNSVRVFLENSGYTKLRKRTNANFIKNPNPKKAYVLTEQDKINITDLYKNKKLSCINIWKELNIPKHTIRSFVAKNIGTRTQTEINKNNRKIITTEEGKWIKELYFQKKTFKEISEITKIKEYPIREYITENNLYKEQCNYFDPELKAKIINMYINQKMSTIQIRAKENITYKALNKILNEVGLKRTFLESVQINMNNQNENFKNIDFFKEINTQEKAYWLGFIYADGNINKQKTMLTIGLKATDKNHLDLFANLFDIKTKLYTNKASHGMKERYAVSLRICNTLFVSYLFNTGIVPNKTYVDSAEIFNNIPENLIRHFLRGYFDGDGCISNNKISFICNSKLFIEKVRDILNKVTGKNNIIYKIKDKTYFTLNYYGKDTAKILKEYFYTDSTIHLERKFLKFE